MLELLLIAIVLGIVEGVTEFLPVSSTAHLLLANGWFGYGAADPFWKTFIVFIQIGAILAVVVHFRERILQLLRGEPEVEVEPGGVAAAAALPLRNRALMLVALGTLPVLAVGLVVNDWVEAHMGSTASIAVALGVGGVAMLAVEALRLRPTADRLEQITTRQALLIGLAQVLAVLFPGVSRSAATIVGGLAVGLSRPAAAEFSFLLAIPAMSAACGYALLKQLISATGLTASQAVLLLVGTGVSFLVAWGVVAVFMQYVRRYSFAPFAVYRILLAAALLAFAG